MAEPQQHAAQAPVFTIDKIYVKDLSLENPGAPKSFLVQEQPQIDVGLRTRGEQVDQDLYEVVLTITITAKTGDQTLFLIEAAQAGVFTIRGIPQEHMQQVMAVNCPSVLFPYARETLADAVIRAGFPPVHLAPINFESLYQQQLAQGQGQAAAAAN